jgi:hypothetical protein
MVIETELFESPHLTMLDFCLCGWMKSEVYSSKLNRQEELLALILDAAARIKKLEDQLRRTTRDLRTRVANWVDFRTFIVNCNKFVISVYKICYLSIQLKLK